MTSRSSERSNAPSRPAYAATQANTQTPIFQAHGTQNPVVPIERGRAAHAWPEERGYPVEWRDYPMEHQVLAEEIKDLARWFAQVFAVGA